MDVFVVYFCPLLVTFYPDLGFLICFKLQFEKIGLTKTFPNLIFAKEMSQATNRLASNVCAVEYYVFEGIVEYILFMLLQSFTVV